MNIEEIVLSDPVLLIGLTLLLIIGVHYQRGLTYREFRMLHMLKCYVFAALDSRARELGRPLVWTKEYREDSPDFLETIEVSPKNVALELRKYGCSPHLLATAKCRKTSTGVQWAHSQWVYFHDDGLQTEIYLFSSEDSTDVYAHLEGSVTDPKAHLDNKQIHGDPRGVFKQAIAA